MSFEEDNRFNEEKELELLSKLATTSHIDWKPAILLSEAYIEKYAKNRLKQILKNRKINLDKKIQNITLKQLTLFLYSLHEINSKEFTEINKIQSQKNRIINPKKTCPQTYFGEKANKKYKPLIESTIKIISTLKNK